MRGDLEMKPRVKVQLHKFTSRRKRVVKLRKFIAEGDQIVLIMLNILNEFQTFVFRLTFRSLKFERVACVLYYCAVQFFFGKRYIQ